MTTPTEAVAGMLDPTGKLFAAINARHTDYIYNDHPHKLSHLVVTVDDLESGGDTTTVCGIVTAAADLNAIYGLCVECLGGAA